MTDHVAIIEKNSLEEVRVTLDQYSGHHLIDVRVYADFRSGNVETRGPTKKGVSLNIAKLPDLIAARVTAKAEAERRGLLLVTDAART